MANGDHFAIAQRSFELHRNYVCSHAMAGVRTHRSIVVRCATRSETVSRAATNKDIDIGDEGDDDANNVLMAYLIDSRNFFGLLFLVSRQFFFFRSLQLRHIADQPHELCSQVFCGQQTIRNGRNVIGLLRFDQVTALQLFKLNRFVFAKSTR